MTEHDLGPVTVTEILDHSPWGDVTVHVASAECSCGGTVSGRCCSELSARQWLATEFHWHRRAGLPAFEVVAELLVPTS